MINKVLEFLICVFPSIVMKQIKIKLKIYLCYGQRVIHMLRGLCRISSPELGKKGNSYKLIISLLIDYHIYLGMADVLTSLGRTLMEFSLAFLQKIKTSASWLPAPLASATELSF